MGFVCTQCRHYQSTSYPLHVAYCRHPNATTIDRVNGPQYPRLDSMLPEVEIKKTTDQCDAEGWFEKPKPWWVF